MNLAKLTGETMTAAVTEAVRERLDRIRRERDGRLADRLLTIGKDCAARLKGAVRIGRSWRVAVRRPPVAPMIIDTSALVAILRDEPEAEDCARAIESAAMRRLSAVNFV